MITALTGLRPSLPAVVNPSRPILVTSALNNLPVTRRLGIFNVQPVDPGSRTSDSLQLAANCCKPVPFVFIHLQPLFCKTGGGVA